MSYSIVRHKVPPEATHDFTLSVPKGTRVINVELVIEPPSLLTTVKSSDATTFWPSVFTLENNEETELEDLNMRLIKTNEEIFDDPSTLQYIGTFVAHASDQTVMLFVFKKN